MHVLLTLEHQTDNGTKRMLQQTSATHNHCKRPEESPARCKSVRSGSWAPKESRPWITSSPSTSGLKPSDNLASNKNVPGTATGPRQTNSPTSALPRSSKLRYETDRPIEPQYFQPWKILGTGARHGPGNQATNRNARLSTAARNSLCFRFSQTVRRSEKSNKQRNPGLRTWGTQLRKPLPLQGRHRSQWRATKEVYPHGRTPHSESKWERQESAEETRHDSTTLDPRRLPRVLRQTQKTAKLTSDEREMWSNNDTWKWRQRHGYDLAGAQFSSKRVWNRHTLTLTLTLTLT